jgi:hypothetical protein
MKEIVEHQHMVKPYLVYSMQSESKLINGVAGKTTGHVILI